MKRYLLKLLTVAFLFTLSACGSFQPLDRSDSQIQSIAIKLNEELNFNGKTNEKYNLQYSNFHYETDGYNRYIAVLHYQYEDTQRHYQSGDVIVYFKYYPQTGTYEYRKTNIAFPGLVNDEAGCINYIKQKSDFSWGISTPTE